jgi:non-ribosomal peptide synthetase component E (peptide arylation enzyme)
MRHPKVAEATAAVAEVPKTSVGRFDKKAVRGIVADGGLAGAAARLDT